jgi:hypothetical protein
MKVCGAADRFGSAGDATCRRRNYEKSRTARQIIRLLARLATAVQPPPRRTSRDMEGFSFRHMRRSAQNHPSRQLCASGVLGGNGQPSRASPLRRAVKPRSKDEPSTICLPPKTQGSSRSVAVGLPGLFQFYLTGCAFRRRPSWSRSHAVQAMIRSKFISRDRGEPESLMLISV